MARKTFRYVLLDPPIWAAGQPGQQEPVLAAQVPAPDGSPRPYLRSRLYRRATDPHESFYAFNARHDGYKTVNGVYADEDGDTTTERIIVLRTEFSVYEFRRNRGGLYATASTDILRTLFKRHRDEQAAGGLTLSVRVVRVNELEEVLNEAQPSMDVVGYSLANVTSVTPLQRYDVLGEHLRANTEVQDARVRADQIRALILDFQRHTQVLRISIRVDGSITFFDYPGDNIALGLLDILEPHIARCSGTESANPR